MGENKMNKYEIKIMCVSYECPLRKKCLRATAQDSDNQAYLAYGFSVEEEEITCRNFISDDRVK